MNCNFPLLMIDERKEFLKKIRNFHRIITILLLISPLLPNFLLNYSLLFVLFNLLTNYYFTKNFTSCWIQFIEWRNSNCENYSIIDPFLKMINVDLKYRYRISTISYITILIILVVRILLIYF